MNKTATIIVGIILIALAFYGGIAYNKHTVAATQSARLAGFAGARGGAAGGRGAAFGGATMGQIISVDPNGITISLISTSTAATGSVIVYTSASTTISQISNVSLDSLAVGQTVTVAGTKDASGAIEATSIQLRPTR